MAPSSYTDRRSADVCGSGATECTSAGERVVSPASGPGLAKESTHGVRKRLRSRADRPDLLSSCHKVRSRPFCEPLTIELRLVRLAAVSRAFAWRPFEPAGGYASRERPSALFNVASAGWKFLSKAVTLPSVTSSTALVDCPGRRSPWHRRPWSNFRGFSPDNCTLPQNSPRLQLGPLGTPQKEVTG